MINNGLSSARPRKSKAFMFGLLLASVLLSCDSGTTIFPLNKPPSQQPPSQAPEVFAFYPSSATEGVLITITGANFKDAVSNASPEVRFNGTKATIAPSFSATSIVATVPKGITTGPITVTVGNRIGTSNSNFIVPSLVGSWKQISHELAQCTDSGDNGVTICNSCAVVTFSATLLTISEPGVPTVEVPYVQNGNLLMLTLPGGTTRTDTFSIIDETLTIRYNGSFGCTGTDRLTRI